MNSIISEYDEVKRALQEWEEAISDADRLLDGLFKIVGRPDNSPISECTNLLQEKYTNVISKLVGDTNDSLMWYWLENEMGAKQLEAGRAGDMKKICNIDDLANLILSYE